MPKLRVVILEAEFETGAELRATLEAVLSTFGDAPAGVTALSAEPPKATHPVSTARELPAEGGADEKPAPLPFKFKAPASETDGDPNRRSLADHCREVLSTGPKTTREIFSLVQTRTDAPSYRQVYEVLSSLSKNGYVVNHGETSWEFRK